MKPLTNIDLQTGVESPVYCSCGQPATHQCHQIKPDGTITPPVFTCAEMECFIKTLPGIPPPMGTVEILARITRMMFCAERMVSLGKTFYPDIVDEFVGISERFIQQAETQIKLASLRFNAPLVKTQRCPQCHGNGASPKYANTVCPRCDGLGSI
jgi:hypothetical protein